MEIKDKMTEAEQEFETEIWPLLEASRKEIELAYCYSSYDDHLGNVAKHYVLSLKLLELYREKLLEWENKYDR